MQENNRELYRAMLTLCTEKECEDFFADLLTTKELSDLSDRLTVAKLLSQGVYYNVIADKTGASTATISRVSKCLAGERGGYRLVLSRLSEDEGESALPPFTLALPYGTEYSDAYSELLGRLSFLPPSVDKGASFGKAGVGIMRLDSSDIPLYLDTGACDIALSSEWELTDLEGRDAVRLPLRRSLCLRGEKRPSAVATDVPAVATRYLPDSVTVVPTRDPMSATRYAGIPAYCTMDKEGAPDTIATLSYLLVFGKSCPAEVRTAILGALGI